MGMSDLVCRVLQNNIALLILIVSQTEENDIALINPHLFPQFAANVRKTFGAIKAEGLETTVTEHFEDLCVL